MLDPLSAATAPHHAQRKIDARSALGPTKQPLHLFDRVYVILADAINDKATLDSSLICRAVRFHRTDQHPAAGGVTKSVGQIRCQIL